MPSIRAEAPEVHAAIRELHRRAFVPYSGEAELVDALRSDDAHVPELCLVAVDDDGAVIGHVFFSRAELESGHRVLALAPMAVDPGGQRRGTGSQLIEEALRRAGGTDYPLVVVLGHPGYYPRFGFRPAVEYGVVAPWEVPPEAWMVLPLPAYVPEARGLVRYPAAFDAVT